MRQVFFKTVTALEAAGGDQASRFSDLNGTAGKLGFWDYYAQGNGDWFTNALFQVQIDTDAEADDSTTDLTTIANPIALKRAFQVVQGYGAQNPIATPIIGADKLVKVTASGHVATTQYAVTYDPNNTAALTAGHEMEFKIVVRQTTTDYLNYLHDELAFADLSGENYHFPLSGFHNNNHKIINISFTVGASDTATCNNLRSVIQENGVLNAMIKCSGTDTAVLTARHPGVVFEVIGYNLSTANGGSAVPAADFSVQEFIPGVGNAWQARADELKQRAISSGIHNRMYFPLSHTDFVTAAATNYDRFEIVYRVDGDRDVVKGSQFGTAIIYEVDAANKVGGVLNPLDADGDPGTTKTEYSF